MCWQKCTEEVKYHKYILHNTWHSLTCASWTGTPHRLRGLWARPMEGCSHSSVALKMSLPVSLYRRAAWTRSSHWSSYFLGDGQAGSSWTRRGLRRSPWGGCPTAESWSPPRLESSLSTACCKNLQSLDPSDFGFVSGPGGLFAWSDRKFNVRLNDSLSTLSHFSPFST